MIRIAALLLIFAGNACTPKSGASNESQSGAYIIPDGIYISNRHYGNLTIRNASKSHFDFDLQLSEEDGLCRGQVKGKASWRNNRYAHEQDSCILLFQIKADTLFIHEEGHCPHGENCTFSGAYTTGLTDDD